MALHSSASEFGLPCPMAVEELKGDALGIPLSILEHYKRRRSDSQIQFDEMPSSAAELNTPSSQCTWKERNGDMVLSLHLGQRGIIYGEITCEMIDKIFARYCHVETAALFLWMRTLEIDFFKPVIPDDSDDVLFARVTLVKDYSRKTHKLWILLAWFTRASPWTRTSGSGKRRQKFWVQGHLETHRGNKVITLARDGALFIGCKHLPKPRVTLPCSTRTFTRMPHELWEMVMEQLPSLTGRYAASAFNFELSERHQRHADIWHKILKDGEAWTSIATRQGLNPVLIGDDLHNLHRDPMHPGYIALSTGDNTGNIRYDRTKLLTSLRAHHWNKDGDIVFDESNIILNIEEALHNPFMITLSPKKLFSYQQNRLRSASLYWKDSQYALRTIQPDDVVGIGERVSTLQDVSLICGITLTHPKEMGLRQKRQQCFQHPNCPPAYPICPVGYKYNGGNILGWDWDD